MAVSTIMTSLVCFQSLVVVVMAVGSLALPTNTSIPFHGRQ